MKKILCLVLASVMLLCFTGCSPQRTIYKVRSFIRDLFTREVAVAVEEEWVENEAVEALPQDGWVEYEAVEGEWAEQEWSGTEAETEATEEVASADHPVFEELCEKLQGYWVDTYYLYKNDYMITYDFFNFDGEEFYMANYPGHTYFGGMLTDATKLGDNRYIITMFVYDRTEDGDFLSTGEYNDLIISFSEKDISFKFDEDMEFYYISKDWDTLLERVDDFAVAVEAVNEYRSENETEAEEAVPEDDGYNYFANEEVELDYYYGDEQAAEDPYYYDYYDGIPDEYYDDEVTYDYF